MSKRPDEATIEILRDLLECTHNETGGTDTQAYRLKNFEKIDIINKLARSSLVNHDQTKKTYRLSLMGLFFANNETSEALFKDIDQICDRLRDAYKKSFNEPILINNLLKQLNIDKQRLIECLTYAEYGNISDGMPKDLHSDDAYIRPSERLLEFNKFIEIPTKLLPDWYPNDFSGTKKRKKPHGNAEIYASKREEILGAALAVIAKYPDECRNKRGILGGSNIAKLIDDHSYALFGTTDPPKARDGMENLINKWLKFFT